MNDAINQDALAEQYASYDTYDRFTAATTECIIMVTQQFLLASSVRKLSEKVGKGQDLGRGAERHPGSVKRRRPRAYPLCLKQEIGSCGPFTTAV